MDPEKKSLNFIFPTKYVITKSLKFSHWPSKLIRDQLDQLEIFDPTSVETICSSLIIKMNNRPSGYLEFFFS